MAVDPAAPASDPAPASQNPMELLRSRSYLVLLIFGAIVGVPVAVIAYYFLKLVALAQKYFFGTLPGELGFHGQPPWWPVPVVAVGGVLVALTLHYLPGTGGHHPAEGFKAGGGAPTAARPLASARGPPEFPGASSKSAWIHCLSPSAPTDPIACTTPALTAPRNPYGHPTAITSSPTRSSVEAPISAIGRSSPSARSAARSISGSRATNSASNLRPSGR